MEETIMEENTNGSNESNESNGSNKSNESNESNGSNKSNDLDESNGSNNSNETTTYKSKEKTMTTPKEKPNIDEVLNEYYNLKSKYEQLYHDKYIKPILRSNDKSKREKRIEYQKLPKPECINCKRNVGSIFTIKNDAQEYSRIFTAKCGDLADPCPLNINFNYTNRDELSKELLKQDNDINEIKNRIIIDKNNMMFGYIDNAKAIEQFNSDTSELKDITEGAGFIMEINIQLNENPVKKDLIKTNEDKLGIECLLPFKSMIKEFDETGNTEILNKAVKFYVDEMEPLAKTIRNLKYEVCYVDFLDQRENEDRSEKGDLYFLVQKKNALYNLEYTLYGYDEVKSFTKGTKDFKSKNKSKTRKNLEQIHNKTRKVRPDIEFIEEEPDEEEYIEQGKLDIAPKPVNLRKKLILENATEALEEGRPGFRPAVGEKHPELFRNVEGNIMPHINPGGNVSWTNKDGQIDMRYQNIWDSLSSEYKDVLSQDEAWMKKTLDNFVEFKRLRAENKVPYTANREFVHPDGLLLPPVKISDTEYDYGNDVYNKLLNNNYGNNIWLSFLPRIDKNIKDPRQEFLSKQLPQQYSNEYNAYLNAIASVLGSKLKFTKI
jgi:hypothetical protein